MAGVLPETITLTVHEAWRLEGDRLVAIDPQAAGDYSIRGVPLGEGEQAILVCDRENTIVARLDQVAPGETQAT